MEEQQIQWFKPARSGGQDNCMKVAYVGDEVWVGDTKLGDDSPILKFGRAEWEAAQHAAATNTFNVPVV